MREHARYTPMDARHARDERWQDRVKQAEPMTMSRMSGAADGDAPIMLDYD